MAARRLLILMLVLLGVSTLAAALVPPQAQREDTASETATEATRSEAHRPPGRLVKAKIDASRRRPRTIDLRSGDELSLVVRSRAPDQAEIPAFGLLEDVGRDDPARFDLLPERTGSFEIRLVEAGRVIGRIAVGPERRSGKRKQAPERDR
jgi:hypothetical protein